MAVPTASLRSTGRGTARLTSTGASLTLVTPMTTGCSTERPALSVMRTRTDKELLAS